jgi:hypothetical protein
MIEGCTVIGVDSMTGTKKFSVPLAGLDAATSEAQEGMGMIIAGDGYAYVVYSYRDNGWWDYNGGQPEHVMAVRVNTSGVYDTINVLDFLVASPSDDFYLTGNVITNADQGIVITWSAPEPEGEKAHMVVTTGASAGEVSAPTVPGQWGEAYPALQAQDGSFIGTVSTGDTISMISFDATGNVRWSMPGYCPMIATADGGVIAQGYVVDPDSWSASCSGPTVTFDQNGNATGQMALATSAVPNWGAQVYTSDTSGVSLDYAWVQYGSGFWMLPGGNPSANATSALNVGLAEGFPLWAPGWLSALFGGTNCKLGSDKILLGQEVLSKDQKTGAAARAQYDDLKQKLLTFLGALTPASSCAKLLGSYWNQVPAAVTRQVPYDGLLSNLSAYDAGEYTLKDQQDVDAWPYFKKQPICSPFWNNRGDWSGIVATAQTQPPSTDVYFATQKNALKNLTQSTVLHESLHNLTGLDDDDLYYLLSTQHLLLRKSVIINTVLEQNGCVGK